ncbi:hypothetical protein ACGF7W_34680 [Streptomyces sp. NPDC048219]|uniref:hypothetical protein n=1 Tax=Streptomyces TaxID=1883 RepID=UPI003637CC8B
MSQQNPAQRGENEPLNRDERTPAAAPQADAVPRAALVGAVKGTMIGLGTKAGKWLWEKGVELKDHWQ